MNFQLTSDSVMYNPDSMYIVCNLVFTHASGEDRQYINILWDSDMQSPIFNVIQSSIFEKGCYKINMPDNDNFTLKDVIDKIGISYIATDIRLYDGPYDPTVLCKTPFNSDEIFELPFFCIDYLHANMTTNEWFKEEAPKGRAQIDYLVLKKKMNTLPTPEWVLKYHPWYQNAEKEIQTLFDIEV